VTPRPFIVAALLAGGCLTSRGTAEAPIVSAVRFSGLRGLDSDALAERLATHGPEGLVLRDGHPLDTDALGVDRRRVEAWCRERGYYGARVVDVGVEPDGGGRVKVTFRVEAGSPIRVREVQVTGLDGAPEAKTHLKRLPIEKGQIFDVKAYDRARGAIEGALRATGWGDGSVRQSAQVIPEEGVADVTYAADPGHRLKFGAIRIEGAVVVPEERIREKVRLALKPGDWFDEAKIELAQARIFEIGVFGGVRVTRGPTDEERGEIPILVQVREAQFHTLSAGPGIAFQQNRWEARLSSTWTNRNFLGDLRRLSADAHAGWAFLPSPFNPNKQGFVGLGGVELLQPRALGNAVDATLRLELERSIEEAYSFWSQRGRVGLPVRIGQHLLLIPTYNAELYEVEGIAGTQAVSTAPLLASCPGRLCLLSYVEERLVLDLRDNPIETRRGFYFGVAFQQGFRLGVYGYQYLRFLPELRAYFPLGGRVVLAARARMGGLVPVKESSPPPIVARFTAGGPISMRGYYVGRLSPLQRQDGEYVPVGGNGLVDGSIELRFDASRSLGLALFLDGGNVSKPEADGLAWLAAADPTLLQYAAGIGLRYRTPVGPLRLDVAVRVPNPLGPSKEAAGLPVLSDACVAQPSSDFPCVHREPLVSVHLTLGEAF
jgi:translocation and assembly module TamA